MKYKIVMGTLVLLLLSISISSAESSLDVSKNIVENYYLYSMQNDVDSYATLFDQSYLTELYGDDYKEFFEIIFDQVQIQDYEIEFQQYTESQDSLTLFFNLQSSVIVDGQELDLDNDMVAFFSKSDRISLRYIMLQEEFISQMNKEFVYKTALANMLEQESDIKELAVQEGVSLTDYASIFEDKIKQHNRNNSAATLLWIAVILILLSVGYLYSKRNGLVTSFFKNKNVSYYSKQLRHWYVIVSKRLLKSYQYLRHQAIFLYNKYKP